MLSIARYFKIAPINRIKDKFTSICTLINPFELGNIHILDFSSKPAVSDISVYIYCLRGSKYILRLLNLDIYKLQGCSSRLGNV